MRGDGRLPVAALAEQLGISRANAHTRLERLQRSGVITGFSAQLDAARAGLPVSALVFVSVHQEAQRHDLPVLLETLAYVHYAAFVTGEYDLALLARVPDVDALRDEVIFHLQSSPYVRSTHTALVLQEVIDRPLALPPSA